MRQAGRYLPEYRALRERAGSFLDLCYTPALAAEATLQPIRRFGFDAAILFSDILIVPHALGLGLSFVEGEGPRVERIVLGEEARLARPLAEDRVAPVYEAVAAVRAALPAETPLIGFVGAPWTVATYLAAGRGSPDHAEARLWAYRDPSGFGRMIDALTEASTAHLLGQVAAGADIVQIFDSWAGELPADQFARWCLAPLVRIVAAVRQSRPGLPVIAFARGAGSKLGAVAAALPGVALGLDTAEDAAAVHRLLPPATVVQGNLDPLALIAGGGALEAAAKAVVAAFAGRPHIFNLGHGIRPETPIAHVEHLLRILRGD
jgi:uroporphyrinogen decarboxylase